MDYPVIAINYFCSNLQLIAHNSAYETHKPVKERRHLCSKGPANLQGSRNQFMEQFHRIQEG